MLVTEGTQTRSRCERIVIVATKGTQTEPAMQIITEATQAVAETRDMGIQPPQVPEWTLADVPWNWDGDQEESDESNLSHLWVIIPTTETWSYWRSWTLMPTVLPTAPGEDPGAGAGGRRLCPGRSLLPRAASARAPAPVAEPHVTPVPAPRRMRLHR